MLKQTSSNKTYEEFWLVAFVSSDASRATKMMHVIYVSIIYAILKVCFVFLLVSFVRLVLLFISLSKQTQQPNLRRI